MALKLEYFDGEGRAEVIRLAFLLGGVTFNDVRLSVSEWVTRKEAGKAALLGQLPILHVGDACFAQSAAQLRYAGRLAGLYPIGDDNTDHLAALAVDEVVETALEILNKAPNSEDQAKKQELRTEYANGHLAKLLGLIEQRIEENRGPAGRGWCAGAEMTIADVALFSTVRIIQEGQFDFVAAEMIAGGYPGVAKLCSRIRSLPQVEERYGPAPPTAKAKAAAAAEAAKAAVPARPAPKATVGGRGRGGANVLPAPEHRTYSDHSALGKAMPPMETLQFVGKESGFAWEPFKPAMVVFWASYAEGDHLVLEACSEIANGTAEQIVMQTVAISCDAKKGLVETFAAAADAGKAPIKVNLPLAFDPERAVRSAFQLAAGGESVGVSTVFLINGEGLIVWKETFSQMHPVADGQLGAQVNLLCTGADLIDNGPKPAAAAGGSGSSGGGKGAADELSDLEMSDDVPSDDSDGLLF